MNKLQKISLVITSINKPDSVLKKYYSMCETSKRRIKEMQDQGISTKYDAKEKQEDVGKNDSYTFMMF